MRAVSYLSLSMAVALVCLDSSAECLGSGAKSTVERVTKPLGRTMTFLGDTPEEIVVGVDWAEEEKFKVKLRFSMYGKYAQYSAEALQVYEVTTYEARPVSTLIANTLTLGLFILANPKRQIENLAGCTDERPLDVIQDTKTIQKTEQFEWKRLGKNPVPQRIKINSLTEPFMIVPAMDSDVRYVDLKESILNGLIEEDAEIILDCLSCNAEAGRQYGDLPLTNSTYTFKADFRAARAEELEKVRIAKEEEEKQAALEKKKRHELELEKAKKERALQDLKKREEAELQEKKRKEAVRNGLNSL